MSIVDLQGRNIALSPEGTVKNAHDPDRVHRRRTQLHNQLEELQQGWHRDCSTDTASRPDADAIDAYWDDRWRSIARTAHEAKEPVLVEFDAMATWMKEQRVKILRGEQYQMLLKDVQDLSPWSFKKVGENALGTVWLCDRCAVCIDADGMTLLMLRKHGEVLQAWSARPWMVVTAWDASMELPDLQLGELFELLKILRYTKLCALPEPLMAIARNSIAQP